jgi:HIT domain
VGPFAFPNAPVPPTATGDLGGDVGDYQHHLVYENEETIAFLSHYPTMLGYCLVAPKRHVENWVHGMESPEFLRFQGVVHEVARAITATLPTERMRTVRPALPGISAHVSRHESVTGWIGRTLEPTATQPIVRTATGRHAIASGAVTGPAPRRYPFSGICR